MANRETREVHIKVTSNEKGIQSASKQTTKLSGGLKGVAASANLAAGGIRAMAMALLSSGIGAIVVALGGMIGFIGKAISTSKNFEKSLSTLSAISGATSEEMKVLKGDARELGRTTQFTASQVVELQTELAKLGFSVGDIRNSTPAILDLAASLDVGLAEAATFAGSTVRAFGLQTQDTQRVVDVLAKSTSSTGLSFVDLQESIKMVAPVAAATNVSVEKTTALLGVLADRGVKGSIAGTGLSKTFIELSKKGITLEDAMSKVSGSANQLNTAVDLVGVIGAKSLLNLAKAGEENISKLEAKFLGAEGAAKQMADVKLDNLQGDITRLSSAWEGLLLGVEDGDGIFNKISRGGVQLLTWTIGKLGDGISLVAHMGSLAFNSLKSSIGAFAAVSKNILTTIASKFMIFGNEVKIALADIPIIGKGIDKAQAEQNIKDIKANLDKIKDDTVEATKKANEDRVALMLGYQTWKVKRDKQVAEGERIANEKANKEAIEQAKELQEKLSEEEQKALDKKNDYLNSLKKQKEDQDADDFYKKLELQKQREIEKMQEAVKSETERREALKTITEIYDAKKEEYDQAQKEKEDEKKTQQEEKDKQERERKKRETEQHQQDIIDMNNAFENAKVDAARTGIRAISNLLGENKAVQRVAIITDKLLALGQVKMNLGKALMANAAHASTMGPLGAAYLVKANKVAKLTAVKSAVSIVAGAAQALKSVGGGASAGGSNIGGGNEVRPPSFNVIGRTSTGEQLIANAIGESNQQPVQAYVVESQMTSQQQMSRNVSENASL